MPAQPGRSVPSGSPLASLAPRPSPRDCQLQAPHTPPPVHVFLRRHSLPLALAPREIVPEPPSCWETRTRGSSVFTAGRPHYQESFPGHGMRSVRANTKVSPVPPPLCLCGKLRQWTLLACVGPREFLPGTAVHQGKTEGSVFPYGWWPRLVGMTRWPPEALSVLWVWRRPRNSSQACQDKDLEACRSLVPPKGYCPPHGPQGEQEAGEACPPGGACPSRHFLAPTPGECRAPSAPLPAWRPTLL